MVKQIYIPQQVKDSIQKHLTESIAKGLKAYESAFEDEDTLTGHLFGLMKIEEQSVVIDDIEIQGNWKWSIDYKKFGGRGKGATESIIGADGIFELSLFKDDSETKKCLLFQSKLDWTNKDEKLYLQCAKLTTWLGAAIVVNYTQDQIETYLIDEVIANQGGKPTVMKPLNQILGKDFIDCLIGDSDLKYDASTKRLIWLDKNDDFVATQFNLNRRLKIKVTAPKRLHRQQIDKIIRFDEISQHQLKTDVYNFALRNANTLQELKKVKSKFSMTFHPDRHFALPQAQIELFSNLMKQFNNEIDIKKEYFSRKKNDG